MGIAMTTAYEVLGVDLNADDVAIKAAFRKAAKECHPDLNKGDRNGERLRRLLAARASALTSLRQLESMSRDLAAKAAGKERSSLLAVTIAAAIGLLFLYFMSQRPELTWAINSSLGTLHLNTQVPASRWKGPASPSVRLADKPAQTSEMPPSFDVAHADQAGKLVAAGRGKAGWIIRLMSGTQALGETTADERNEWVLILEKPLAPGNHAISLFEVDPVSKRGIAGQRSITLSIASRQGSEPNPK
jgi:DnaJ domain